MTEVEGRTVTTREMLERTGITYRRLDWWCAKLGLIPNASPGSGRSRSYTEREVMLVKAATAMADAGLRAGVAVEVARRLVDSGEPVVLAGGLLVAAPEQVTLDGGAG